MRRARLRTKTGCLQCRKRRMKCDEVRPCSACRRAALVCSLGTANASVDMAFSQGNGVQNYSSEHIGHARLSIAKKSTYHIVPHQWISETAVIIDYYTCHSDSLAGKPSRGVKLKIIELLPIVSNDRSGFASLMAFLTALMPSDWPPRAKAALHFEAVAASELSHTISRTSDGVVANETMLSAGLLYLSSLYEDSLKSHKRTHIHGLGALLTQHTRALHSAGLPVPTDRLQSYLFHMVLSSTVDFGLVLPATPSDYVDRCIGYVSDLKAVEKENLDIFGVPMLYLSSIFHCSCLRNGLITGHIDPSAVGAVHEDRNSGPLSRDMLPENIHDDPMVVTLYQVACCMLSDFLLQEVARQVFQASGEGTPEPVSYHLDAHESLLAVGALKDPHHRLTWPLFIVGLGEHDPAWQDLIDRSLQNQIRNHRLRSATAVLNALRECWKTRRGLAAILDEQNTRDIMF